MPGDYSVIASIYEELELGEFATQMVPQIITYAQRNDWAGRSILDLGCGTGRSMDWLAAHGYVLTGIDRSSEMLQAARQRFSSSSRGVTFVQQDIRKLDESYRADLALAIDVVHELESLRDLESTFQSVYSALRENRWFIFDLLTVEGLVNRCQPNFAAKESETLNVFFSDDFDYERQFQERRFIIFNKESENWKRREARRTLRSYPIQAVSTLLQRSKFRVNAILSENLQAYEPGQTRTNRVIIMAQKQ